MEGYVENRTLPPPILFSMSQHIGLSHPLGILRQTPQQKSGALPPYKVQNWPEGFINTVGTAVLKWVGTQGRELACPLPY